MGIQHVPKIRSIWNTTFGHLVWEMFHEVVILFHEWPEIFDSELVIRGSIDPGDFMQLQKLLFVRQNLFEEIFGNHVIWRCVQLHYTK